MRGWLAIGLLRTPPDLIITDLMMPKWDGIRTPVGY